MFTFDINPQALLAERAVQLREWGIPRPTLKDVARNIRSYWQGGEGGWRHEWVTAARNAEQQGNPLLAAECYACARFPCSFIDYEPALLDNQAQKLVEASRRFSHTFIRQPPRPSGGRHPLPTPIHLYAHHPPPWNGSSLIILSGGIDTGKTALHRFATALMRGTGQVIAAVDMPGTDESGRRLSTSGHEYYLDIISTLKHEFSLDGKVAIVGLSFGGYWATRLVQLGAVDCAVSIGGPVTFRQPAHAIPAYMINVIANALGMDAPPSKRELSLLLQQDLAIRLRGNNDLAAPLLFINGELDPLVDQSDAAYLQEQHRAVVRLLKGTSHCAVEKLARAFPFMAGWLRLNLGLDDIASHALYLAGNALLFRQQAKVS